MLIQLNIFLSLAISFTIVFFAIPTIIKISIEKKLFDVPNHRSATKHIVPTLGGIAIYAGFRTSQIISLDSFNTSELKYMSLGALCMFFIGLKDDILGVAAKKKLLLQVLVSLYLVILGHYRITNLHGILGLNEINYAFGLILSVIAIVGIINAINLIDGIDGLSSGICILIAMVYGIWFLNAGDQLYAITCFCVVGSLSAFFLYNVFGNTNKIFMGDTGSLILGTIMAILTIHFNEFVPATNYVAHGLPAISFAIAIVPIVDTLRVFAIRLSQRKSPFTPDMNHIHHKVLLLTGSHLRSSLIIIGINALIILFAFSFIDVLGNNNMFFLLVVLGFSLANIPSSILWFRNKNTAVINEKKSILAFSVFLRKNKGSQD